LVGFIEHLADLVRWNNSAISQHFKPKNRFIRFFNYNAHFGNEFGP